MSKEHKSLFLGKPVYLYYMIGINSVNGQTICTELEIYFLVISIVLQQRLVLSCKNWKNYFSKHLQSGC